MLIINAVVFMPDGTLAQDRFVRIAGTRIEAVGA